MAAATRSGNDIRTVMRMWRTRFRKTRKREDTKEKL